MSKGVEVAQLLFRAILKRPPNANEVDACLKRLDRNETILDIVVWIADSAEARLNKIKLAFPPGHFYSPIVDTALLINFPEQRSNPPERLPDVAIDLKEMTLFWESSLRLACQASPFSAKPTDLLRYGYENPAFSFADAIILRAMMIHFRPKRVIEIGSGWSTACILDSVHESNTDIKLTCIEPYPALLLSLMREKDKETVRIIEKRVQDVAIESFDVLESNDILFIDSTHVLKTGSDVNYELFEVIPRLKRGVIIHFHDIFYPFEYGFDWVIRQNRSWNELYAVRAFLTYNSAFRVLFFNDMFAQFRKDILIRDCPDFLRNSGGSLWLQKQ